MLKVKIAIRGLSVAQKITLARRRERALTNNSDFPDAAGPLTNYSVRTQALDDALQLRNKLATDLSIAQSKLDSAEAAWDQESALLGNYVQMRSGGEGDKILRAGHDISGKGHKAKPVGKPEGLAATMGDQPGYLDLVWDPVEGRRMYVVEICTDPNANSWQQAAVTSKSRVTLKGLTPGVSYYIRVAAIGAAGQGPWGGPTVKMAP